MKLAAKQLLALGVKPAEVVELQDHAKKEGVELRVLVQRIIHDWLHARRSV